MPITLPEIPDAESTPWVRSLLDIIHTQQQRIQQLEEEIRRLKGLTTRPQIAPSTLETPPRQPPQPDDKRPGSAKRPKTAQLVITQDVIVAVPEVPPDAVFKGYEDYVVQDLVFEPRVIRYRRQRWRTADGHNLVASLPADVIPGCHFGPDLICFILHQYHHQHVTQPLLLEQLHQLGIDISAGQLSRLLTETIDVFTQEKAELLPAALAVSAYVQVDDTGARHQGHTGYCTHIGNELFACFVSTDSKSRINFLEILRGPQTDYVIDETAVAYWLEQKLAVAVVEQLRLGPCVFADAVAWQAHLAALAITGQRPVRIASEGALLGSLITHGVAPELVILSDGAPQFDVLVHASCWMHAERPLARMIPYSEPHRVAIATVRGEIWALYQDLKAYRQEPKPEERPALETRFDALCGRQTCFPSVNGVLQEMADHRSDLLRVLDRPEVPLHNNLSEGHIRDYVKKRKISGSTRSGAGRAARDVFASLKKTCRRLGVNFWSYLQDRVRGRGAIPRLSALIRAKAEERATRKAEAASPTVAEGGAAG
jgi:Transposase IS66 family